MSNTRKKGLFLAAFLLLAVVLAACQPQEVEVTRVVEAEVTRVVTETITEEGETVEVTRIVTEEVVVEVPAETEEEMMEEPVTLHVAWEAEPPQGDPALATDNVSIRLVGNTFMGLTRFDAVTGEVLPYLATDWEAGEDADGNQTWTFNMRGDIPWVHYDPVSGETTQVTDEEGNPRFVTAGDVEYGVKRTLDPATGSDYAYVLYIIKNGEAVNSGEEGVTVDDLGVTAIDDTTVQFTLENPAGFFPSIAGMWVANPQPQWNIEEFENQWTEAGLINTNGPYNLAEWIHGGSITLVKNPLWPDADTVQIERVTGPIISEASTRFALYENNEVDMEWGVPQPEIPRVKADPVLGEEYFQAPDFATYYYGFNNQKYPFTDRRVRAAFTQSIDRQSLIDNVTQGGQTVATSFAAPGIFGAPEPGTVGLAFDPAAAQASLQEFLDEEGLTLDDFNALDVVLMHNTSEGHARIAAAIQQMWADNLGVEVRVENQEWAVYLETLRKTTPIDEAPHIFRLGWGADYPDENNWVHEVFNSDVGANRLRRNCLDPNCGDAGTSEFDEITAQAGVEQDPAVRIELYEQAERLLTEEEVAMAPIYHYAFNAITKPWLERTYARLGADSFYTWTIDQAAQMEAMN